MFIVDAHIHTHTAKWSAVFAYQTQEAIESISHSNKQLKSGNNGMTTSENNLPERDEFPHSHLSCLINPTCGTRLEH